MRSLGFQKNWAKLSDPVFTTFRFPRKDSDRGRDWRVGETVQVVLHSRTPQREVLFCAEIIGKESTELGGITDAEAVADGFPGGWSEMANWLTKTYGKLDLGKVINKLTLMRCKYE